ncbi:ArsR/SmtB family transcription factor [Streptococcus pantholopis]|uniref:ArsR family transcriptional regulator n=1 Tax=Streptococcus pantholopis TaxID=1811193 RepID=A0A172Q7T6_9STRE|nr:metalloregulator ArsR/SmtB family transcription factor [Streptococcus pantholopis]AND79501.1 ArsR family transcriptional regulator [Streptococcus pantholopis]
MEDRVSHYKNSLYGELAKMGKGLSNEKRIEILSLLMHAPKTVEVIANETGMSVANTSRHLQILKETCLVKTQRSGNFIIYALSSDAVAQLVLLLRDIGQEERAEIKQIETEHDQADGIPLLDLSAALMKSKSQDVMLLDLRPEDEYQVGHLPRAVNLPISDFSSQKTQLPMEKEIIVYCRGRFCANANLAAKELQDLGYRAYSLNSSYIDWKWSEY